MSGKYSGRESGTPVESNEAASTTDSSGDGPDPRLPLNGSSFTEACLSRLHAGDDGLIHSSEEEMLVDNPSKCSASSLASDTIQRSSAASDWFDDRMVCSVSGVKV